MEEVFKVEHRDDHIHVVISPDIPIDNESRGEFWGMLRKLCEERDCRRILVEGRVPEEEPDPSEVIAAGERTATVPNVWMAFHFEDFVPNESSELFEAVAASHGVRVKHFDNAESALKWLRANAPK